MPNLTRLPAAQPEIAAIDVRQYSTAEIFFRITPSL